MRYCFCRKSSLSTGRPPRFGAGSSPQQASRFSGLRGRASPQQSSAATSRQGSGQLRQPSDDSRSVPASGQGSGLLYQAGSVLSSQPQLPASSALRLQSLQAPSVSPQASNLQWQSNMAYSPQNSATSQHSNPAFNFSRTANGQQAGSSHDQQSYSQAVTFTSTPRLRAGQTGTPAALLSGGMVHEGSLQQPGQGSLQQSQGSLQQPPVISQTSSEPLYTSQPRLQASGGEQGYLQPQPGTSVQTQDNSIQPLFTSMQPQGSIELPSTSSIPLAQQTSGASQQAETSSSTPQGAQAHQDRLQQPRTYSGVQRQGWFQNDTYDDAQDPNLHGPRYCHSLVCYCLQMMLIRQWDSTYAVPCTCLDSDSVSH